MIDIVAIDVDGVLADFIRQCVIFYNNAHPDDLITSDMIQTYNIRGHLKYKEPIWELPGFYSSMPLMKDAVELFPRIYRSMETLVVTATPEDRVDERLFWFDTLFPDFNKDNILFEVEKQKVADRFDVIFEDSPDNILAIGPQKCITYSQPYNLSDKLDSVTRARVNNWQDIYMWLKQNAC